MMPDLVLLDIDMPGATGIQATAQLRQKGYRGKIVLLTVLTTSGYLQPALDAGANGYLLKTITGAALKNALKAVMAGHSVVDPELAAEALRSGPSPLTERETEVLRLVAEHRSTSQIAGQLYLSVGTIRNYLSSAMTKLAVNSRFDAADLAKQNGWLYRSQRYRPADGGWRGSRSQGRSMRGVWAPCPGTSSAYMAGLTSFPCCGQSGGTPRR